MMLFLPKEKNQEDWYEFTDDARYWYMKERQELEERFARKMEELYIQFWEGPINGR